VYLRPGLLFSSCGGREPHVRSEDDISNKFVESRTVIRVGAIRTLFGVGPRLLAGVFGGEKG